MANNFGSDFLSNLAANLATNLLQYSASYLREAAFGDAETRALEAVWQQALNLMLQKAASDLEKEDQYLLEYIFRSFLVSEMTAENLLSLALEGNNSTLPSLISRFNEQVDAQTLPIDATAAFQTLADGLTQALITHVATPGSALHNRVNIARLEAIHKQLQRQSDQLDKMETAVSPRQTGSRSKYPDDIYGRIAQFRTDYEAIFGGRQQEMAQLNNWLKQKARRLGLLMAPSGMGKSALITNWVKYLKETQQAYVTFYPISSRYGTNSSYDVWPHLLGEIDRVSRQASLEKAERWQLLEAIDQRCSERELKEICLRLNVDYENLLPGGKREKARELVEYCERRDQLTRLWQALLQITADSPSTQNPQALLNTVSYRLREFPVLDKPLVILIDGLDELDIFRNQSAMKPEPHTGFEGFPNGVAENVYLLLTIKGDPDEAQDHWISQLRWWQVAPGSVEIFGLNRLDKAGIVNLLQQSRLKLESAIEQTVNDEIFRLSDGEPLLAWLYAHYLKGKFGEDIITGEHFKALELNERGKGILPYIKNILQELEPERLIIEELLEGLSLARGLLTLPELEALGINLATDHMDDLERHSGWLIVDKQSGLALRHARIYEAFWERLSPERRADWLERFHEYGRCTLKRVQAQFANGETLTVSPYILNYYAEHLQLDRPAGYEESLYALVDEAWMKAHYKATDSYDGFLRDVKRAWKTAEEVGQKEVEANKPVSTLGVQVKCALANSSVASLLGNLPPALPAMLVRDGKWSPKLAMEYAGRIPDRLQRTRTRLALLRALSQKQEFERAQVQTVGAALADLAAFAERDNDELRARLLLLLLPHLSQPHQFEDVVEQDPIEDAVEQARSLRSVAWQVRVLGHLVPRLPVSEDQTKCLTEVLSLCAKINFNVSAWGNEGKDATEAFIPYVMEAIACNLPPGILQGAIERAFDVGRQDTHSGERQEIINRRAKLLENLALHIPKDRTEEFLQVILGINEWYHYANTLPALIIRLAPRLTTRGIITAFNDILSDNSCETPSRHRWYESVSETSSLQYSQRVALAVLGHFCTNENVKMQIGTFLKDRLLNENKSFRDNKETVRYKTILALYQIVFEGCPDEEVAERVDRGEIEFTGLNDHVLFPLFGSKTIRAIIEQFHVERRPSAGPSQYIRCSPYYLQAAAERLKREVLDVIKVPEKASEFWYPEEVGGLRAVAVIASHLSAEEIREYAQIALKNLRSHFDISLEILQQLAPNLPLDMVEEVAGYSRGLLIGLVEPAQVIEHLREVGMYMVSANPWPKWLLLEHVADHLNDDVRENIACKLRYNLEHVAYSIDVAQLLVILRAGERGEHTEELWKCMLEKSSFLLGDLPMQIEAAQIYVPHVSSKHSQRWQLLLGQQIREGAAAMLISRYPRTILSYLPLWQRIRTIAYLRKQAREVFGITLKWDEMIKLIFAESKRLKQIVQFMVLALPEQFWDSIDRWYNKRYGLFNPSPWNFLSEWVGGVPPGKFTIWLLKRRSSPEKPEPESAELQKNRMQAVFLQIAPLTEELDDHRREEQQEILRTVFKELRGLRQKAPAKGDLFFFLQALRLYGSEIWEKFPTSLFDLALQVAVTYGDDSDQRDNLLALLPGLAAYRPDLLSEWRTHINDDLFWFQRPVLLSAWAAYVPLEQRQQQSDTIEEALSLTMPMDRNDTELLCGLVLGNAVQYVPDALLPFVVERFVDYHPDDSLGKFYERALLFAAERLDEKNIHLVDKLEPLIKKLDYRQYNNFIKAVASRLNQEQVTKLLHLTSEQDRLGNTELFDSYRALSGRWLVLPQNEAYKTWRAFIRRADSLRRAQFLHQMRWLPDVVTYLGDETQMIEVGDSIVEVGQWQW